MAQIRRLRNLHPNLGKEKRHVLLAPWCAEHGIVLAWISTLAFRLCLGHALQACPSHRAHLDTRTVAHAATAQNPVLGQRKPVSRASLPAPSTPSTSDPHDNSSSSINPSAKGGGLIHGVDSLGVAGHHAPVLQGVVLTARGGKLLPVLDALGLLLAGLVAHLVRFRYEDLLAHWQHLRQHPLLVVVGLSVLWAVATAAELYQPKPVPRLELLLRVGFAAGLWSVLLAFATYLVPTWKFGRGLLVLTASGWGSWALTTRLVASRVSRQRARPLALVVGESPSREEVAAALASHPFCPWTLQPVELAALPQVLRDKPVALVVVAGTERLAPELVALHFSGVPLMAAAEVMATLEGRLPIDQLPPEIFLHQREFGAIHWEVFNRATRVLDVVLSLTMLLITLPLMALVAALVRLVDGAPVLYRQWRLGQFGRPFQIWKFRTMRRDAETNGPEFEGAADPRVTPLGRILRRFRLDELPQLWNVLRGDMSLVGPRPERSEFVKELAEKIPYYVFRLAVPPGLTGWAQVNMPYARTLEEHKRKLEYDLYFIRERTLSLYLTVLLRTVSAALFGVSR